MRWSIVSPTLTVRRGMTTIFQDLNKQIRGLPIEIVCFEDTGQRTTGAKMNELHRLALGDYISVVADDDLVTSDYVESIFAAIEDDSPDLVTFDFEYHGERCDSPGGVKHGPKRVKRGRHPLCAIKADICRRFDYPNVSKGEDSVMRRWLNQQSLEVFEIERVLYFYNYRVNKPEFVGMT